LRSEIRSIITPSSSPTLIQCWEDSSWLEKSKTRFSDKWSFRSHLTRFYRVFVFHTQQFLIRPIQQILIRQISIQQIPIWWTSIWWISTLISWLDLAKSTTWKHNYVEMSLISWLRYKFSCIS
jgi:hypothetical protein